MNHRVPALVTIHAISLFAWVAMGAFTTRVCAAEPSLQDLPSAPTRQPPTVTVDSVQVVWEGSHLDGTRIQRFARVEPWSNGYVRGIHRTGEVGFISAHQVRAILDPQGEDVTRDVIDHRRSVGAERGSLVLSRGGPSVFRGRPLPEQTRFHLIQAGVLGKLDEAELDQAEAIIVFDLGTMKNVTPKVALGATLGLAAEHDYLRIALKPRFRRWLTRAISVDVAPGVFLPIDSDESSLDRGPVGFVGEASLVLGDWITLTGQVEVVGIERTTYAGTYPWGFALARRMESEESFYLGGKFGGSPFAIPAACVVILAAVGLFASSDTIR